MTNLWRVVVLTCMYAHTVFVWTSFSLLWDKYSVQNMLMVHPISILIATESQVYVIQDYTLLLAIQNYNRKLQVLVIASGGAAVIKL